MSKLTLSVDDEVVLRAKRYAKQHRASVSEMVEAYLNAVASPRVGPGVKKDTPILRSLRGILKRADPKDYRRYLENKYR